MPTFQLQCCSLLQGTSADEDKEEMKRALKIRIKEHKAATRQGETEKSATAEHTWDSNTQYCGRRPALLVTVASYLLASLTMLCIYTCALCVAMSDVDTDGAIVESTQPTEPRCDHA